MKLISLFLLLFLSLVGYGQQAKYIFYFIGDGMGLNHVNATEMYNADLKGHLGIVPLCFTTFPYVTFATTFSASSLVTDSSAAGTAMATGVKTDNHAMGVDTKGLPLVTIAEKAKRSGRKVGITTSVPVNHATPAAFYAHQPKRTMYDDIVADLIHSNFDFFGGSGFQFSKTNSLASIYALLQKADYTIVHGWQDYQQKKENEKLILVQTENKSQGALPYAIDSDSTDLTLPQITCTAIDALSRNNKKGFFLMVEGGKIDWAAHTNDAATVIKEIMDMDNAVRAAYAFYKQHPKETLIVVSADHETGGLALGDNTYSLNLKVLENQRCSQDALSASITALRKEKKETIQWEDLQLLLSQKLGLWKPLHLTKEQEQYLYDEFKRSFVSGDASFDETLYSKNEMMAAKAVQVLNQIARVCWSTKSHSAAYVPVYAIGVGAELFTGQLDNTDIPKIIEKIGGYTRK